MLIPNPFSLSLNLTDTDDFFVRYLLRVYHVLNAQTANVAGAIGPGVIAWPDRETSLLVSADASGLRMRRGAAFVESEEFGVVAVGLRADQLFSWSALGVNYGEMVSDEETLFVHAGAVFDEQNDTGAGDSRFDNSLAVLIGTEEVVDGALLLAEIDFGATLSVRSRRVFLPWDALLERLERLENDLGYNASERAKGTVAARLNAISGPVDPNGANGVTPAQFLDLQNRVSDLESRLAVIAGVAPKFPDENTVMAANVGAVAVGVFEVNPPAMQRPAIAALGRGFGNGQNQTPDVSPSLDDPRLASYDPETGLLSP